MIVGLTLALTQEIFRQDIDLNRDWRFATLSNPPSIWTGADAIPTSTWKVLRVSSEETEAENASASKAFDGNPNTFWHTKWQGKATPYPHELVIDLGAKVQAVGFRLLPRQTGAQNGKPNHIQVFLSNQNDSWGDPVVADAVPNVSTIYQKTFSPHEGRFLRLVVTDGQKSGEPFLVLSEIGLIRSLDQKQKQDWESQYHIASVSSSDDRFDLHGEELEKIKAAELTKIKAEDWKPATLPHAAWTRPLDKPDIWQGITYYRRILDLSPDQLDRYLELEVGGAMQVSDLWVNGEHIATRRGGYLPLVANVTGKLKQKNDLLIRIDNSDNPLVPPGKPQQDLDFMYGNGLYREAKLRIRNLVHIASPITPDGSPGGVFLTTSALSNGDQMEVHGITVVRNDSDLPKSIYVQQYNLGLDPFKYDDFGTFEIPAHSSHTFTTTTVMRKKKSWWTPSSPTLYSLSTQIFEGNKLVDASIQKFGVRTVEVSREKGFVLNGQPLELRGTNRHQDYPWVGPALSRNANWRDAKLIKDSGHNIVRLSHYPQSEEFLDACDELGIFVIPCIPGWQFINKDPRFQNRVLQDIREMIQRDGRHPCVAWWEASLNETYPDNETAKQWYDAAKSTVLGSDVLVAGDARAGSPWDIPYNQWKDEDYSRPQDAVPGKPGYVREYGDYEFGGAYSSSRVQIRDGLTKLLQETWNHVWSLNHLRPQLPWTMGFGTWEMFDHNVPWEFSVSASGLADLFRRPKPSYWFYKSQASQEAFVKLAADWQPGEPKRKVVVFTNCDEVILKVNGKVVARSKPTKGKTTHYPDVKSFDGSNTENLSHPPVVFENVDFRPGTLQVVGVGKNATVRDEIQTAGNPHHLKVWVDTLGVPVGLNDLVFVRAAVVDQKGVICPNDSRSIQFSVQGATFAGQDHSVCQMGVASALVRTGFTKEPILVKASAIGVAPGETKF